ncbi:Halomucin [Frankliniella fusca]|uniref:Halomucin n=1 Tax=Frankliniella fusca TaxID=407009 RepID=A0AAE1HAB1_9NEOP|nr:Halomucin [Frankliniella fusca]
MFSLRFVVGKGKANITDATSYSSHEDSGSDSCTSENDNETDQGGEENEYSLSDGDGSVEENRAHTGPDGDSGNEDEALNNFQGGQDNTSQSSDDSGSGSSSSENDNERDQEREDNANSSDEGEGRDDENGAHREPNEDNENFEMCDPFKRLKSSVEDSFSIERQLQVNISIGEILINALALVKNHNWSHLEKEHLMKFAQSILKCGKILPDSRFLLDQYFYSKEDMQYFFFCSGCYKSLGAFPAKQTRPERIVCPIATCETVNILSDLSQATYFVTFYLPSQIEVLLSNPDIRRKLVSPSAFVNVPGDNIMRDLYDGKMYRKFANIVKDECNSGVKVLSLTLSVDSASLCSFSGQKICPCFVMINELPPVLRMGNPLLAGLWFGLVKEKMDLFLPPIIKHITKLSSQGFFLKFSPEEEWFVKVFLIACCADSVARCDIQGIHSHRGDFPCSWCLEEGEEYINCRIFRHTGPLAPPRTIRGLIEDASNAIRTQTFVNGVKYLSPLAAAPLFHPVNGFIVDQLHAKDEGTTKAFILAWLNDGQNYPHYIGRDHQKDLINAKLKKISLPKEARKNIRDLNNLAFWTGRENENFGLFLSVPVLVDILPSRFLKHWALYVQVNYILLCTEIPIDVLPIVEAIVDEFVSQVERLYYPEMMRFNMHLFRHFVDNARRWGGIYALSAYGFEAGNQKLKKLVHSANFIPNQICRGLAEENALVLLKRHCSTETTKAFESSFDRKASTSSLYDRTGKVRLLKKGKLFKATVEEEWFINRMGKECADFLQYSQLQKDGCCFGTHSGRRKVKTDNSFAMLASKEIILIRKILYHEHTSEVWIVGSKVRCEPSPYCPLSIVRFDPSLCFQYSVISIDEDIGFHEVESLSKVCVNIKLDNCHYLSPMPNLFNMY